jgi:cell division protein FtsB
MIDASLRGSHDLEKIIYELRKENDRLKEETQALEIKIKKLEEELDKSLRSNN